MRLYLAGGINGLSDAEATDWREYIKKQFVQDAEERTKQGHIFPLVECIDPMRRDYRGREHEPGIDKAIVGGDLADIRSCQVMISMMPKPSWGTGMETFWAFQQGVWVIAVVPAGTRVSPWVTYHSSVLVHSLDDAVIAALHFAVDGGYLPARH